VEVQLHAFLTSSLDGGDWSLKTLHLYLWSKRPRNP